MRTPNVTREELDEALAWGLKKAREIHKHVERYEDAVYDHHPQGEADMARSKRTPLEEGKTKGV